MNILAIDPGQKTGWAESGGEYGREIFESIPWRHPQAHYLDFEAWLIRKVADWEIEGLAFEAAFQTGRKGNMTRLEWQGIIRATAARFGIVCISVFPSSLKKYATGNGRAEKPEMIATLAEKFGVRLAPGEHDICDAVWVLSWAQGQAALGAFARPWERTDPSYSDSRVCNICHAAATREGCSNCGCNLTRVEI